VFIALAFRKRPLPLDIDDDLYLIEDDVTPERYCELESGAPATVLNPAFGFVDPQPSMAAWT
jgi:hypothetical protein